MGEVFDRYTDTVGNYHFTDTETGHHVIPRLDNNSTKVDNKNDELSCSAFPNRSDLISRQNAVDLVQIYLDRFIQYYDTPEDTELYAYCRGLLIGIVNDFKTGYKTPSAQPEHDGWIPTKVSKPPKAGQYLVTKQQKTGVCQIATAHYNPSFDEWSGNGNFTKVLAWQQLPTPYTQE